MVLNILLALASSLIVTLAIVLINNAIRSRLALKRFKKQLPNVPFLDEDVGWFSNHLDAFMGKRSVQTVDARHIKYGEMVAYMVQELPVVSTTNLDLIKHIVMDKASVNVNRVKLEMPMDEIERDCIFTCENEQWRKIRRSFAPALKPARFKSANVVGEIELSINKLLEAIERSLGANNSAQFDVEDFIRRYSLQLVLGCLYKQYNVINFNLDEPCRWVHMVDSGLSEMRSSPFFRLGMIVPSLRHLIDWISYNLHPIGRWRHQVLTFIKQQSVTGFEARKHLAELKRSANGSETLDENNFQMKDGSKFSRNMIDYIVDQFHSGKLTKDEYFHSSFLLFGAADKTASDALVHTLYQLGVNQDIQEKLRKSIQVDGVESEYLAWVTNESLRLNPPASIGCSRTICEPVELKGQYEGVTLPAGTFVFTCAYTIHRLKKYWGQDAEEFRPERWAKADSFHPAQFIPFGGGLRGCPGKEFALFEMKMLVCALLQRYRLQCKTKDDILDYDSPLFIFNIQKTPLYMTITRLP